MLHKLSKFSKKGHQSDLSEYAVNLEHNVDETRRLASETVKTLQQNVLFTKRNKKLPDQQLVAGFKDALDKTGSDGSPLFRVALQEVMDVSNGLVSLRRDYEAKLDKQIAEPMTRLAEETCVVIGKHRRNLTKATNEAKYARDLAIKKDPQPSNTDVSMTASQSSLNVLNDTSSASASSRLNQVAEKDREVVQQKDYLLRDLFQFALQENNYATLFVDYLRLQESYLENCLTQLRVAIPELTSTINKEIRLTVFHRHLPRHLSETGRDISYVLERCIGRLDDEQALSHEGLFRRSGSHRKVEMLMKALDLMQADDELLNGCDYLTISSALKQYLSSIPEPLITYNFAEQWALASQSPGGATIDTVRTELKRIPKEFRRNLAYLCLFLARVTTMSAANKMTSENLSICIAPNMYRTLDPTANAGLQHALAMGSVIDEREQSAEIYKNSGLGIHLMNLLIQNADSLFAREKDDPTFPKFQSFLQTVVESPGARDNKHPKPADDDAKGNQLSLTDLCDSSKVSTNPFDVPPSQTTRLHSRKKGTAPKPPLPPPPIASSSTISDTEAKDANRPRLFSDNTVTRPSPLSETPSPRSSLPTIPAEDHPISSKTPSDSSTVTSNPDRPPACDAAMTRSSLNSETKPKFAIATNQPPVTSNPVPPERPVSHSPSTLEMGASRLDPTVIRTPVSRAPSLLPPPPPKPINRESTMVQASAELLANSKDGPKRPPPPTSFNSPPS